MSESGKNRRDRAAAARDAAAASEKKRERVVRLVGALTVLVVVVGIIGVAVIARNQSSDASSSPGTSTEADPSAPSPSTVLAADDPHAYGVPYGSATDVPVLEIWEDFQCPACGAVEQANGAGIASLAETGKVKLIWRPTTFLDRSLGNDASERAVAAWGCAIDAGKAREFHDAVYANQPEVEGTGWTNEEFIAIGGQIGLSGAELETFTTCVNDGTYRGWAANSTQIFYDSNLPGTPLAKLDGVEVPTEVLADPVALEKLVADATAQ